jgi:hypothetical protein
MMNNPLANQHPSPPVQAEIAGIETGETTMNGNMRKAFLLAIGVLYLMSSSAWSGAQTKTPSVASENKVITEANCTAAKLGSNIPTSAIGEPVSRVTLDAPSSAHFPRIYS